jgi:hypothetical protein
MRQLLPPSLSIESSPSFLAKFTPLGSKDAEPVDLPKGAFILTKADLVLPGWLPVALSRRYQRGGTATTPSWSSPRPV